MTISIYVVVVFCVVFGFSILANIIFIYFMYLHITRKLEVGVYTDEFGFYEPSKDSTANKDKKI